MSVIINERKEAAITAEKASTGHQEFRLMIESNKMFEDGVDRANAWVSREELTQLRDALTALLEG